MDSGADGFGRELSALEEQASVLRPAMEETMSKEKANPKSGGPVTVGSDARRSSADRVPSEQSARPVSSTSEAIIKEVSVRRRTAMKVLADR